MLGLNFGGQVTVYFSSGTYNYSSGLAFNYPVAFRGEPGSWLCYEGTAHAVDLGQLLTASNYQALEYIVDGLQFTCGGGMTEGIFLNQYNVNFRVRHCGFLNFGGPGTANIWTDGYNWDILIEHNWFWQWDSVGRTMMFVNSRDGNSQLRFIGNDVSCL